MTANEFLLLSPFLVLGLGAVAVLLAGVLPLPGRQTLAHGLALALLAAAFALSLALLGQTGVAMDGGLRFDAVSYGFDALACAGAFGALVLARGYAPLRGEVGEAFGALVLFAVLGMFILISADDLLVAFLGLELVAVPLFGLVAWVPRHRGAIEGGLKYAVLSGVAAAFFLYGLALIYAGSGTLALPAMGAALAQAHAQPLLTVAGFVLLLVGIGFELALVPFHMWAADVYEGAPVPVSALLGTVAKVAMLVFLVHLLGAAPPRVLSALAPILAVLAVLGMLVGNLLALRQTKVLRLLGYSTIAHFGYVLAALSCVSADGYRAALYYGLAYAVMNMAVFAVFAVLSTRNGGEGRIADYRGVGRRHPWLGLALVVGVLSLAGLPPTAGFFAKLFVLSALLHGGHVGLAVVLVLATAASFYYYLRLLLAFFQTEETTQMPMARPAPGGALVLGVAVLLTLGVGVWARAFF
ncbi:NADH-quinone oxidoreductase subunit N [Acidihalobacter ferrooxydans]|uniref:NADH-quinone oxidoreductase subunit N n=1 Tax=Acidihalobacter ferrooxydans TaxID=1765967 RepID=A0A1P8UKF2_9GAMM|nr:NADH-quinone oxidoreductase subunit N [Acidihalobacter ferrooxydans]APZ44274.1 hypothetical protein BW247_15215 [Acidihalobacter ferrooxydans]